MRKSPSRPAWERVSLLTLLTLHAALVSYGAFQHSPTYTELMHIVAGLYHLDSGSFAFYRVNPPLVRMVACLPIRRWVEVPDWNVALAAGTDRPEAVVAEKFLELNADQVQQTFGVARLACVPFSLLGLYICWRWSRELFGPRAGLLSGFLWCLCPNICGYGQLLNPDVPAAALSVSAAYVFWKWRSAPSWTATIATGILLGLAQLARTTCLVLYLGCLLLFLWDIRRTFKFAIQFVALIAISLWTLNFGYRFEGTGTRLDEFEFVSQTLGGAAVNDTGHRNRFFQTALGALAVPLPYYYVSGLDAQKHDFENRNDQFRSYLRGKWSDRGWWWYYLYGILVKVPVSTLLLVVLATGQLLIGLRQRRSMPAQRDPWIGLLLFLLAASSQTGFNIHFRYVLPAFPFLFVLVGQVAETESIGLRRFVVALTVWTGLTSLFAYPHQIAYFNELVGGPRRGHNHLRGSALDWGQDLWRLRDWVARHPESTPLHFACDGAVPVSAIGPSLVPLPLSFVRVPGPKHFLTPAPGWYAISINLLYREEGGFEEFQQIQPVAHVGYTILIFNVRQAPRS